MCRADFAVVGEGLRPSPTGDIIQFLIAYPELTLIEVTQFREGFSQTVGLSPLLK
jgi:hypothetical protein